MIKSVFEYMIPKKIEKVNLSAQFVMEKKEVKTRKLLGFAVVFDISKRRNVMMKR